MDERKKVPDAGLNPETKVAQEIFSREQAPLSPSHGEAAQQPRAHQAECRHVARREEHPLAAAGGHDGDVAQPEAGAREEERGRARQNAQHHYDVSWAGWSTPLRRLETR